MIKRGMLTGWLLLGLTQAIWAQNWLEELLQIPQPDSCRAYLFQLTEEPHVAGTEEGFEVARYIYAKFKQFGLQASIDTYDVYLPYPHEVHLTLLKPENLDGPTPEQGFAVDKDSYASNIVPGFNAYSPSGEATGQVVYVNYGREEDYQTLRELGVSVKGKIALARYGKIFRGSKAYLAEREGAAALILYSDPADDGYMKGDVYPFGPYRPEFGVQRGSILYMFLYPGDPLTPEYPALPAARRMAPEEAGNLPQILTLPISYGDARAILKNLAGPNVPSGWQGGLPFAYHTGPGPAEVRLLLDMDFQIRPIWNVMARIPGKRYPDQVVIIGNHHDAWTYGAVDPGSGTAVMLEIARTLSGLLQKGWQPQRTILLACWDAEEYGLIGSTEWVEANREWLQSSCVAYINIDAAVSGNRFRAAASPLLKKFIQDILKRIPEPRTRLPLMQHVWKQQNQNKDFDPAWLDADSLLLNFSIPGSGSDFTAFLDFAGIPSLSMWFGGRYGVYHATYDNFYWMEHFGDPEFLYHATMARIGAAMVLELADAPAPPYDLRRYAQEILQEAEQLDKHLREQKAPHDVSMEGIVELARRWLGETEKLPRHPRWGKELEPRALYRTLLEFERIFLHDRGLPDRPWYKHQFYAPGLYTGYAVETFPAIRHYIRLKQWDRAIEAIEQFARHLEKAIEVTGSLVEFWSNRE